jgi:putative transposase
LCEDFAKILAMVRQTLAGCQDARMALRWTAAAMLEAAKGFRRLKAHRQLPVLRAALAAHQARHANNPDLEQHAKAA